MEAPKPTFETEDGQTILYDTVRDAMKEQHYTMELVGAAAEAVEQAVNHGIDSHLEGCFMPILGDNFEWKTKEIGKRGAVTKLHCKVSKGSLPVLLRRLYETEWGLREEACRLADDILGTLGLRE
jgi:hypothetical protein